MSHTFILTAALPKEIQSWADGLRKKYYPVNRNKLHAHVTLFHSFAPSLFEELKARIKEDDQSVPYKYNGYWYIVKYETGKDYPIYVRKKGSLDNPEELLFDCNQMAEGHEYFKLVGLSVSPDNSMIAFGVDIVGRRN